MKVLVGMKYLSFLNKAIPLFTEEFFFKNAYRSLILNLTANRDVFEKENYGQLFQ